MDAEGTEFANFEVETLNQTQMTYKELIDRCWLFDLNALQEAHHRGVLDINEVREGFTLLGKAVNHRYVNYRGVTIDFVRYLVSIGAELSDNILNFVLEIYNEVETPLLIKELIKREWNTTNIITALIRAFYWDGREVTVLRCLVSEGVDVNKSGILSGKTALHWCRSLDKTKILLEAGFDKERVAEGGKAEDYLRDRISRLNADQENCRKDLQEIADFIRDYQDIPVTKGAIVEDIG